MAISSETSSVTYAGNNSTVTAYTLAFPFTGSADLVVTKITAAGVRSTLAITTGYTLVGDPTAGTATLLTVAAIALADSILIERFTAVTQTVDSSSPAGSYPTSIETQLDRTTRAVQDNKRIAGRNLARSVRVPDGELAAELPAVAVRKGEVIYFNASTGALETKTPNEILALSDGAPLGVGIPAGGTTGQALVKTSATDYAADWDDVNTPTQVAAALAAATDEQDADNLRSLRVNGFGSLATIPKKLWRLAMFLHRRTHTPSGFSWPNRVRALILGDSVSCDIGQDLQNIFGAGGGDLVLPQWTKQANSTPTDAVDANFASWSNGVFSRSGEFPRALNGTILHLDASFAAGTYVEKINVVYPIASLHVGYLSANGHGSFKLQQKVNGTGAWTDVTVATVTAGGGSASGGVVDANNSGAEVYATAVFTLPTPDVYHLRIVATAGRAYLSSAVANAGAMVTGAAAGYDSRSGALSADFSHGGKSLSQHFKFTPQAVVTAVVGHFDPQIIVYKSANDWSLANYQADWPGYAAKLAAAAPNALLVVCGSHPRSSSPLNDDPDNLAVDDYLKEWCSSQNGAIFVDVRQSFPEFIAQYSAAIAFTLTDPVIASTAHGLTEGTRVLLSTTGTLPTNFNPTTTYFVKSVTANTYELSSTLGGASITPTTSQSGTHSLNTLFGDDMWSDGIHLFDQATHAGGNLWVRALVMAELQPILDWFKARRHANSFGGVIPVAATEFRMYDGNTRGSMPVALQQRVVWGSHPRFQASHVIRPTTALNNNSNFALDSGWGTTSGDALNPHALILFNRGQESLVFGNHSLGQLQGFAVNFDLASTTNLERTRDGYRFLLPTGAYGRKAGLIIEGQANTMLDCRLWGLSRNSSSATEGAWLCAWMNGGVTTRANGATTSGLPNITFAGNGALTNPPPGAIITGTGIPAGTRVLSSTASSAVLSQNATATNTGLTFTETRDSTFDFHGQTSDVNFTSFAYQEPTAPASVFIPVCSTVGTGDRVRAIAVVGSYATQAAGEAAVGLGEVFYDEATSKTRCRLV